MINKPHSLAQVQRDLFEQVAHHYNSRSEMVEALGELLNLERGAVYQRTSGKKIISIEEYSKLIVRYDLPEVLLHALVPDRLLIQYPSLLGQPDSFEAWLGPILLELKQLAKIPNAHIYYAANELPFLHYFKRPVLAIFKNHIWNNFTWLDKLDHLPRLTYSSVQQTALEHKDAFEVMSSLHQKIGTTEVWHTTLLNNTLSQIEYLWEVKAIEDPALKKHLLEDLHGLLEDLEDWAIAGHKCSSDNAPFILYHNEIVHTNNLALLDTGFKRVVMWAYDNPNYMRSSNEALCSHTENYFRKLMSHSTSLAGNSQKARTKFFYALHQRIAKVEAIQ